ncbi:MAG: SBBP repeat-containing protein, partial [Candidatus Latescibacterota bacterium]
MRRRAARKSALVLLVMGVAAFSISSPAHPQGDSRQQLTAMREVTSIAFAFTENSGQWDERVLFRADAAGAAVWFTAGGVYYQFVRRVSADDDTFEQLTVRTTFDGANPAPRVTGVEPLPHHNNYFFGADPNHWYTDVPNYRAIVYEDVYDGIDLRYYNDGQRMEYDFVVAPGADPAQIKVRYEGIRSLSVNENGELVATTDWDVLKELAPRVYQKIDGDKTAVPCAYRLASDRSFGFELRGAYDAARPLVIDPGLFFGTCLGGAGDDLAYDIAIDDDGFAYVCGVTYSFEFPTQLPQHPFAGIYDGFVTKVNPYGDGVAYSTYLGGTGGDRLYAIAVDDEGCAYVTGSTASTNYPTVNAYQPEPPVCDGDAVVTKFNPCGNGLVWSTYLGGSDVDWGYGIAVDGEHHVYVAGTTQSTDFPTQNPYQTDSALQDAYVVKFNAAADSLIYGTYVGGNDIDGLWSLAVDATGHACIVGVTVSTDFPTVNEFQTDQGNRDAFVTRLTPSGSDVVFSTYLGGN